MRRRNIFRRRDLVETGWTTLGAGHAFVATLVEREKEIIETVLAESHGQVAGRSGAAAKLGIPRQTLESKIRSLGIDKHRFKARQTT